MVPTSCSMTPCSLPSRRGLEALAFVASEERRPALTAAARGVQGAAGRDEETAPWSNKETDQLRQPINRRTGSENDRRSGGRQRRSRGARAWLRRPRRAALDHGVDIDDELPGAGHERDLVRLAGRDQPPVERDQRRVPALRGRKRRRIECPTHALAPARDVADADISAAVVVVG